MTKTRDKNRLEVLEAKRLAVQRAFDLAVPQNKRNLRGQFATPPALAVAMVKLARNLFSDVAPARFFDPGVGTGVFFSALLKVYGPDKIVSATGFEVDEQLLSHANSLWGRLGLKVRRRDFTHACPPPKDKEKANLIICNPPYVRHHHLGPEAKAQLKGKMSGLGFNIHGLAGLYCYFLLLADEWLATNGGAVWIVPAEFLDVNYGAAVKRYLTERVTTLRIHRFHPTDVQFSDALVTSVILAFKKTSPQPNHRILFTAGGDLIKPSQTRTLSTRQLDPKEKWSSLFATTRPVLTASDHHTLADIFWIKRGLATGANEFFILKQSEAEAIGLPGQFLRPIFPGHRLVPRDVIQGDDSGFPVGLPRLVLLDCSLPRDVIAERFSALDRYLLKGERDGLPKRYLLRSRSPWYSQEQRPPAPILCTYMGRKKQNGRSFRFIRNHSRATAANVYLLLYPKPALAGTIQRDGTILDRIFAYLQAVPNIELAGRVYGGGLYKLEPKELGRLEIPADLVKSGLAVEEHASSLVKQGSLAFTSG